MAAAAPPAAEAAVNETPHPFAAAWPMEPDLAQNRGAPGGPAEDAAGLSVIVRVLGLILCAMAVQFVLAGMADATHGLILKSAAAPYAH